VESEALFRSKSLVEPMMSEDFVFEAGALSADFVKRFSSLGHRPSESISLNIQMFGCDKN
jgi:hypothetical protein